MKRGIATVCMSGTLADKLTAAAEAGYNGVEIFENDLTCFEGSPEDVRASADSLGVEILALQPFRDFERLPEPPRARAFDRARRKFELMDRLGTRPLLLRRAGAARRQRPQRRGRCPGAPRGPGAARAYLGLGGDRAAKLFGWAVQRAPRARRLGNRSEP